MTPPENEPFEKNDGEVNSVAVDSVFVKDNLFGDRADELTDDDEPDKEQTN